MVRTWVVLGVCSLFVAGTAVPGGAESIFSSLGLGEKLLPGEGRGSAMGGTGISLADTVVSSFLNPAGASLLNRVTVSVVYAPEVRFPDGPEGVSKNWNSRLTALRAVFPFPRGVALSLGFMLQGDMNSAATWAGRTADAEYVGDYERKGGVYSLPVHLSFTIGEHVLAAGGLELTQVSSREVWSKNFAPRDYLDSEDVLEGEFSGARASGAVLLRWPERLALGFVFNGGGDLDGTLTTRPVYGTEFEKQTSLRFPAEYGAGLCYHPKPGWSLALEGWRAYWGDVRIAGEAPLPDRSSHRVAVGLERVSTRKAGSRLSRLPFRVGYWREPQAFDYPSGERVVAQMLTLGTGFPLKESAGRIDLALELGRIGSTSSNGAQEKIARLVISFTASERWQRHRQTRY